MGIQNSVVKNRFGESYKILPLRDINAQLAIEPESFWNEASTQQFINNLTVPNGYWKEIINKYSALPSPSSLTTYEIEQQVCTLMIQGQLKLFPVEVPDIVEHPPEKRAIKTKDNTTYLFAPLGVLLTTSPKEVKHFATENDAKVFLTELASDDNKLKTIAIELNIDIPNTASVNSDELLDVIAVALAAGTVIVIVDRFSSPPPSSEQPQVTEAGLGPGNKKSDLGPHVTEEEPLKNINIELDDGFEKQTPASFTSLFDGLNYILITDMGEEHKGTIEGGKIAINQAKMNSNFKLEIEDMPAFLDA